MTETFQKWQDDVEWRCAKHIIEHPETTAITTPEKLFPAKGRVKIEISESYVRSAWCLYINEVSNKTYFGEGSYQRAVQDAINILHQLQRE